MEDLEAVSRGGCDARVASGGGRMGVTMDRYEVRPRRTAAHPGVTVRCLAGHARPRAHPDDLSMDVHIHLYMTTCTYVYIRPAHVHVHLLYPHVETHSQDFCDNLQCTCNYRVCNDKFSVECSWVAELDC